MAATTAILSSSPIHHLAILIGVFSVIMLNRSNGSWAYSITILFRLALFIIGFRIFIEIIFGVHFGGPVLLSLPEFELPAWLGGINIGGLVGVDGIFAATINGLKLATIVVAASAPAVLVPPNLLLKSMPNAIYEAGLVTVIAIGFLPTLSSDAKRIRTAAALRGTPAKSILANLKLILPLIDSALNRAVTLSNAMESRGFGQTNARRMNSTLIGVSLIGGTLLLLISTITLLRRELNIQVSVMLAISLIMIFAAVYFGGKAKVRTKYQDQEIGYPELLIVSAGTMVLTFGIIDNSNYALILSSLLVLILPSYFIPPLPTGFRR
ncbi:MAG: cobalt transporter permease [Actinomycetota bacterium]|jgi:energy-coupling factor transport system permease protein